MSRQLSLSLEVCLELRQVLFSHLFVCCTGATPGHCLLIASRNSTFVYLFLLVFEMGEQPIVSIDRYA